ncbi:MAG: hypothetical protein GTN36_02665 [Candidatus Aenigmarchaeota archaeon]|nr:hypothetical protein [Candidatus Aenigmarchaeota archaeon]
MQQYLFLIYFMGCVDGQIKTNPNKAHDLLIVQTKCEYITEKFIYDFKTLEHIKELEQYKQSTTEHIKKSGK